MLFLIFTAWRHASAVLCRRRLSVCLSVTSRCSTETAKHMISKQRHTIAPGLPFSDAKDLGKTQTGSSPTEAPKAGGAIYRNGDFRQITRYNSKTSSVASVVNFVQSHVYHAEHPRLFAARLPWFSASRGFVSDSWYLSIYTPWAIKRSQPNFVSNFVKY